MENEREVLVEVNHLNVTYGSGKKAYEAVQDANFNLRLLLQDRCAPLLKDGTIHHQKWHGHQNRVSDVLHLIYSYFIILPDSFLYTLSFIICGNRGSFNINRQKTTALYQKSKITQLL